MPHNVASALRLDATARPRPCLIRLTADLGRAFASRAERRATDLILRRWPVPSSEVAVVGMPSDLDLEVSEERKHRATG